MASLQPPVPSTISLLQLHRQACTQAILEAKRNKNLTWEQIAGAVGKSPVFVTSCCLGENSFDKESAEKLLAFMDIKDDLHLNTLASPSPLKGQTPLNVLLQDPCIYRIHEVTLVYGLAIKELIQEKFGDGIMSAIDFEMEVEKEENPKGDRVKIIMNGKYLPYKKW